MNDIQFWTLLVTSLGVIGAFCKSIQESRSMRKQQALTVFTDYTKRYQEITLQFPESINDKDFSLSNFNKEEQDRILRYMRVYFDLCSEEFYLANKQNIAEDIWLDWASGIKYAFSKPAFREAWDKIMFDTKYYNDFVNWVNDEALSE